MSLLELGGKYREMYTGFKNIEVPCMVNYTHVILQSILHRKLPCHACYVIMFCPHKQILQGNYHALLYTRVLWANFL